MLKKECYKGRLPHYQQPGQWYFVTCVMHNALPFSALRKYSGKVTFALDRYKNLQKYKSEADECNNARKDYLQFRNRYFQIYDRLLNESISPQLILNKENNRVILEDTFKFWEGKCLTSHAWCIMPNHFHWVVSIYEKDEKGEPVYLQDILHSVKLFSARRINQNENLNGQFWMHESFETTIRDDKHFIKAVNYTINNPVKAGLVKNWREWPGVFIEDELLIQ